MEINLSAKSPDKEIQGSPNQYYYVHEFERYSAEERQRVKRALREYLKGDIAPKARVQLSLQLGGKVPEKALIRWLKTYTDYPGHESERVRHTDVDFNDARKIIKVLAKLKSQQALPIPDLWSRNRSPTIKSKSWKPWQRCETKAIPLIMRHFYKKNANVYDYEWGTAALRRISPEKAVSMLSDNLSAKSAHTRRRAARALATLKINELSPPYLPEWTTRSQAREAGWPKPSAVSSIMQT